MFTTVVMLALGGTQPPDLEQRIKFGVFFPPRARDPRVKSKAY